MFGYLALLPRFSLAAFVLLLAITYAEVGVGQTTGVLEGHLKIISAETVKLQDGDTPTVTPQTYKDYPLAVLGQDGKQEVAVVTADDKGSYRVNLPPGNYVLDVQNRVRKHVRAQPVPFTITANQTTHANLQMDTGIR
jgi:hypothetical protein